ncbi:MAG: PD40 domain-containing protein [Bacteroidia bacterium]|nr:PD40 domain-containing protein [Bacteroidia bacterium]
MNTTNFYNSVFRKISKLNFSLDNCFPFFYFLFFIILINNSGAQQFTVSELPLNDVVARSQLGEIANISYSDNGKMVIQLDIKEEQEIYILEKDSKTITKIECQGNETEPCLNKTDGQYLVFTHTSADGNSNIFLANLSTGQFQQITNATDLESQPAIDENAAIISFTTTPDLKSQKKGIQNIAFYNVSTKEIKQITNKEINSYPSVSGNGSSIIYCSSNPETLKNTIYIYNINAGTSIKVVSNPSSEYLQPKLNHDASKALYVEQGTGGGKTFIIELAINIRKAIKQSELNFPCFGKNDSTITYFNTDEGFIHVKNENPFTNVKNDVGIYFKPFFELASEDFKETRTVRFEKLLKYGGIQSIDVAINNTLIMTCNDTLYLYKTGEERATQLSLDNEEIDDIKISEDGQKIVFASKRKGE